MSKHKNKKKKAGMTPLFVLSGAMIGFGIVFLVDGRLSDYGAITCWLIEFSLIMITYFINIIVHEAGHLVAGLISGYRFGSFRVGSLMLVKQEGNFKIKKHSVAGTGGQCLMNVPELVDGDYPVVFYNLGGALMNLVVVVMSALLAALCYFNPIVYAFWVCMALTGLTLAVLNGVPIKFAMINNDGSNALEVYRSKEAKRFFYNQFKIIENVNAGMRLRDMDDALFPMPSEEGMMYSISASGAVLLENRLMDQRKYDEALRLIDMLIYSDNALIELHKSILKIDKMTILLLTEERYNEVERLYLSKGYQTFKKQMKNNISVLRMDFAYNLLIEKNARKANETLALFEKLSKTHPYISDVESERELIDAIKAKYVSNQ